MLNGSSNSPRLHTLDVSTCNDPVQMWVPRERFKATTTERGTLDVVSVQKMMTQPRASPNRARFRTLTRKRQLETNQPRLPFYFTARYHRK